MSGAMRLVAGFPDLLEFQRDLEAVADGLGEALRTGIAEDSGRLLATAKALTPYGPGPYPGSFESDNALPHIRDTLGVGVQGGGIVLYAEHPAARLLEWGGTIAPNGAPITFKPEAMARRAAVRELPEIERNVDQRIAQLADRHL